MEDDHHHSKPPNPTSLLANHTPTRYLKLKYGTTLHQRLRLEIETICCPLSLVPEGMFPVLATARDPAGEVLIRLTS